MGWCVPALESHFVQLDGQRWAFHQPDGFVRIFVKQKNGDGKTLVSGSAWTATIGDETVQAVLDYRDGSVKSEFFFRQGKLLRMVCDEGEFEFRYSGRIAERILSHGEPVLEIVRETGPEHRINLRFSGGKTNVWAICGETSVFGPPGDSYAPLPSQERCLLSLTWPDGQKTEFSYGGANGEAFFTAGDTRMVWNPSSRKILSCGEWMFTIGAPKQEWNGPTFVRRNAEGREETYSNDCKTGLRVEQFADGSRRECRMFTTGLLAGRQMRWLKETNPNGVVTKTSYVYDEDGRRFYKRIDRSGVGYVEGWYDKSGRIIRRRANGKEVKPK